MHTGFVRRESLLEYISAIPPDRRVSIKGNLQVEQADSVTDAVFAMNETANDRPILCVINSDGGEIEAGLSLYDVFRFSSSPIIALVTRRAHSSALLALQGCEERYALKNARLGIHNNSLRWSISTEWKPDLKDTLTKIVDERVDELNKNREETIRIFTERTKLARIPIERLMGNSMLMRSEEALEKGFLDAVAM